jgi:Mrp family chromosome partitioning ATPase
MLHPLLQPWIHFLHPLPTPQKTPANKEGATTSLDSGNEGKTQVAQAQAPDHDTAGDADSIQATELPPLAGPPSVMNVIVVASECAPWSKTGTMKNLC